MGQRAEAMAGWGQEQVQGRTSQTGCRIVRSVYNRVLRFTAGAIARSPAAEYRCPGRLAQTEEREWLPPPRTAIQQAEGTKLAAGAARQAAPLDALHAHGRLRRDHEVPIIVRGEGCYVYDEHGKKLLDGLSALFCVNAGHGRAELGEAAAEQAKELGFYTNWSYAHPRASSWPRASPAWRPATSTACSSPRAAPRRSSRPGSWRAPTTGCTATRQRTKMIARETAYHGTTLGALSGTGITALRTQFEPLVPRLPRAQHEHLPPARRGDDPAVGVDRSSASSSRAPRPWPR